MKENAPSLRATEKQRLLMGFGKLGFAVTDAESKLVEQHINLVMRIAYQVAASSPPNILIEDLFRAGCIGIIEAIKHYDPSSRQSFETFAGTRVKGSIFEEIRRSDWTPDSVRRKRREVERATLKLEQHNGTAATPKKVAEELGISVEEYHQIIDDYDMIEMEQFDA